MFLSTFGVVDGKEIVVEIDERLLNGVFAILFTRHKSIFQAIVPLIVILQKMNEIQKVGSIEGTVRKSEEILEVGLPVVQDKIVRCIIHPAHQLAAVVDDAGTVSPCEHGREEPGDFHILLFTERVGNANRIFFNKRRLVVQPKFLIQ